MTAYDFHVERLPCVQIINFAVCLTEISGSGDAFRRPFLLTHNVHSVPVHNFPGDDNLFGDVFMALC